MKHRIAFIGMGIMGLPMAGHLLDAGHTLTVHSRTKSKAATLLDRGAIWADTPADAARDAEFAFVCVTDTPDVHDVLLGDAGVATSASPGTVVVDHSTISPTATREMAQALQSGRQVALIDAPVSGGDVGARNATLSIMCGGDRQAFDRVSPLLALLGKTITYCGPSGAGQVTKLMNQVLVVGTLMAVSEAIAFAKRGGLDLHTALKAVSGGAAKSWQLEQLGPKIAAGDFAPGFMVDLVRKDLRLVAEFAEQSGLQLPATSLVQQMYEIVHTLGAGREGTQALYKAIEHLNS